MTLESWTNGIARPANALVPGTMWIFVIFVLVMNFGLLNIIVGVFVENAVSTAAADHEEMLRQKEEKFHNLLSDLRALFNATDQDGNGQLTLDEFQAMQNDPQVVKLMVEMD